ncbi:hypothetical protein [Streptomyces sp. S1D4-23]|uniref:hypothetical protein n=1 Tax=Streptomyces sp. S1D4-23 TaxID=2594463 RepID=UPI00116408EE|nr:hypothetical protein [Streptomyces sp. S1D4-23]QDO08275.1 hypothetical protein FNV68_20180 [Streptomyces sp. S1D4-23]
MGDDSASAQVVLSELTVIRLLKPEWIMQTEDGTGRRISSNAMANSSSDDGMSTFLEEDIIAAGKTVAELFELPIFAAYTDACKWTVSLLRELGQDVERDPVDYFPGHALVIDLKGNRTTGAKRKLAKAAEWI